MLPHQGSTTADVIHHQSIKDRKLLVRPDARVHNMDSNLDALTNHLPYPTLIIKKSQANAFKLYGSRPLQAQAGGILCFYCITPSHGDGKFPDNPRRDMRCPNFARSDTAQTHASQFYIWAKRVSMSFKIAVMLHQ